jgi:Fe2+ transport system protein B
MFIERYTEAVVLGLTNKYSDDYGALASAKVEEITFALCCKGRAHYDTEEDNCERCGLALFWQRKEKSIASLAVYRHKEKYRKLKETEREKMFERIRADRKKEEQKRHEEYLAKNAAEFERIKLAQDRRNQRNADSLKDAIRENTERAERTLHEQADRVLDGWWKNTTKTGS